MITTKPNFTKYELFFMNKGEKHPRLIGMSHHNERELDAIEEVAKYIYIKNFQECNNLL